MLDLIKRLLLKIRKEGHIFFIKNLLVDIFVKKKPPHKYPYIILAIIEKMKAKSYLEIGVLKGDCFFTQKVKHKIAVDLEFKISRLKIIVYSLKNKFYEMPSDEFFIRKAKILTKYGLDIAFIDGLHTYEQSLKDVLNSLKYLNNNGYIILHDCYPQNKLQANLTKSEKHFKNLNSPKSGWSGDVWKTIAHLRSTRTDLKILVINYDSGIGIISKGKSTSMLNCIKEDLKKLTYDDLIIDPKGILNLKPLSYFFEFIKTI